jgi:hypothetical protein
MSMIERSPKFKVVRLSAEQVTQISDLAAERQAAYERMTQARLALETLCQEAIGREYDWEFDDTGKVLIGTKRRRDNNA